MQPLRIDDINGQLLGDGHAVVEAVDRAGGLVRAHQESLAPERSSNALAFRGSNRTQSSGGFELDAAVLGDHGAQPFGRFGQVNVTDVNRRDEEHV